MQMQDTISAGRYGRHYITPDSEQYITPRAKQYLEKTRDMTYKQIGRIFGVSPRSVEQALSLARMRLSCKTTRELYEKVFH